MNSAGWVVDDNDEAVFIDISPNEGEENLEGEAGSKWPHLPDLLLEQIFSYLSLRERYYASLVCVNWNRAFYLPYVWKEFVFTDTTLTRAKYNYYLGWQYVLDHLKTSLCLSTIGKNIRTLILKPMYNFTNVYEFMNIVAWFIEQSANESINKEIGDIGNNITHLKFVFPCDMTERGDTERMQLFGTGGKLLGGLKKLMGKLEDLHKLELVDLMLEANEAKFLLDGVCDTCHLTLRTLRLVNATKLHYEILHAGVFLNLYELHISPQNLGEDLVQLLGQTKLKHLHILQNTYTMDDVFVPAVAAAAWKAMRKINQKLNVHLAVESKRPKRLVWQEGAPVRSVLYDSSHIGMSTEILVKLIDYYKSDLRIYGHLSIPRFHMPKSFFDRNDGNLLLLVRQCSYLSTLIVTEKVSTGTVLLVACAGRNLKRLHVRGNGTILKCEWTRNPDWSDEFYAWLKSTSKSYDAVEKEISQILGYRWRFLSDKEFKRLKCDVHDY
ncbi:uncharacterized protein LOC132702781 [Cylas formicarius]|uniref:uncharacterized protein LOC132702781 n=1 Tax=Cylas formicarius TaxID=197179 RepID=UPI002958496F|nr:uncharacterized protein LOC132702781 [Cylas formicarius]